MRTFVYVAGFDYMFKRNSFLVLANRRMEAALSKYKGGNEELNFTILDFSSGKIFRHRAVPSSAGLKRSTSEATPYRAITGADYDKRSEHPPMKTDTPEVDKIMSILDVYKEVKTIGVNAPGSLNELSIFSHGWMGGAVLANTYESPSAKTSGKRDPKDKDARVKDFSEENMPSGEAKKFRAAYSADGINWLWGCSFPKATHGLLHKITNHRVYHTSSVSSKAVFEFPKGALTSSELDALIDGLGFDGPTIVKSHGIEITFAQIKEAFIRSNQSAYAHALARMTDRVTFAAPVGTFSGFESGATGLMRVSKTVGSYLHFYKQHLQFEFDSEKRNYAKYPTPNV